MLENINRENVLFLDIETVPQHPDYDGLAPEMRRLWDKKAERLKNQWGSEPQKPDSMYDRAGIYAEFGKIICISVGVLRGQNFYVKSYAGHDEKALLGEFIRLLSGTYGTQEHYLCAHNGKEFDFPYLARRMMVNGLEIPSILSLAGLKPWEVRHLDTMELWKFGDHKSYTSLELLSEILGLPSPKDDIDGSMVGEIYWKEEDLPRIVEYCQKDVLAVAQIFLRYRYEPLIEPGNVIVRS